MDYWKEFEKFWKKYRVRYTINNENKSWLPGMERIIKGSETTVKIDENLKKSPGTGKEIKRIVLVDFYQYLRDKGIKIDTIFDEKRFYDDPAERRFMIAKFLHVPKTMEEIMDEFMIVDKTASADLAALIDGVEFLGATVKLVEEKKGTMYYYRSTLHPVFLPLNLSEAYAITRYLKSKLRQEDVNDYEIRILIERIESQLTPYAYEKIYGEKKPERVNNNYVSEETMIKTPSGIIPYLMKSKEYCKFYYGDEILDGQIVMDNNECKVVTKDGREFELEEVSWIVDSLQYR